MVEVMDLTRGVDLQPIRDDHSTAADYRCPYEATTKTRRPIDGTRLIVLDVQNRG